METNESTINIGDFVEFDLYQFINGKEGKVPNIQGHGRIVQVLEKHVLVATEFETVVKMLKEHVTVTLRVEDHLKTVAEDLAKYEENEELKW